MSIFDLHAGVVRDYQRYVQSFLSISDDEIRRFVERKLVEENVFWADALISSTPSSSRRTANPTWLPAVPAPAKA